MNEVIVITGGSSGIGLATAAALRKRNCRVYELSRRNVKHENGVLHLLADVTDEAAVKAAIDTVIAREGRVDVLICNAGFGISGAAEFTENEAAKHLLDVNLFGAVNAVKAVLPRMRAQHSGRILCICSIAAPVPIPFQAWYSVSKAAVRAYASALRGEVSAFGVQVASILPGDIRSGFTGSREKSCAGDDVYKGRISRSVAVMEHDERTGMTAEAAGEAIAGIASKGRLKPDYAIGLPYKGVMLLLRVLPGRLTSWIVRQIYAG